MLTVSDCPHRAEAIAGVREALDATGHVGVAVTERVVATVEEAAAAGMHGSPTILVDGGDLFSSGLEGPSLSCRLYRSTAGVAGAPAVAALIDALDRREDVGRVMGEGGGDGPPAEPGPSGPARGLAVRGFVALWRGERPGVGALTDDAAMVEALVAGGRLEVDEDGLLVGVHGLVARPTAHRIEHPGGLVHTWCAFDAVGIPAALAIDAAAVTSCPACGTALRVVVRAGVPQDKGRHRLWLPGGECAHLVEDFCRHANLYCDADHLASVVRAGTPGTAVTVTEAAAMGRAAWDDVARVLRERKGDRS